MKHIGLVASVLLLALLPACGGGDGDPRVAVDSVPPLGTGAGATPLSDLTPSPSGSSGLTPIAPARPGSTPVPTSITPISPVEPIPVPVAPRIPTADDPNASGMTPTPLPVQ